MNTWMDKHPRLSALLAGLAVACALLLLGAEALRDPGAEGRAASYYSQF